MSPRPVFVGPLLHLRTVPAFAGLSHTHLAVLGTEIEEVVIPRGVHLLEPGRVPEAFHLLIDGEVDVLAGPEAGRLVPPSTVGFTELLAGRPAGVAYRAGSDVIALRVDGDAFRAACERHFGITQALLAHLASLVVDRADAHARALRGDPALVDLPAPDPLDRVGRMLALHRCRAFPSDVMDALAELAGHAYEVRTAKGERLWRRGEPAEAFRVVCEGDVELRGFSGGRTATVGVGGLAGLLSAVMGGAHRLEAVARSPVVAIQVDVEALFDVLDDHFEMASGLLAHLAGCLLESEGASDG